MLEHESEGVGMMGMALGSHDDVICIATSSTYYHPADEWWDNYEFRLLDTRWPRQQIIGCPLSVMKERVWRPPEAAA